MRKRSGTSSFLDFSTKAAGGGGARSVAGRPGARAGGGEGGATTHSAGRPWRKSASTPLRFHPRSVLAAPPGAAACTTHPTRPSRFCRERSPRSSRPRPAPPAPPAPRLAEHPPWRAPPPRAAPWRPSRPYSPPRRPRCPAPPLRPPSAARAPLRLAPRGPPGPPAPPRLLALGRGKPSVGCCPGVVQRGGGLLLLLYSVVVPPETKNDPNPNPNNRTGNLEQHEPVPAGQDCPGHLSEQS